MPHNFTPTNPHAELARASHGEARGTRAHGRPPCEPRSRVAANPYEQGAAGEAQRDADDPAAADRRDLLLRARDRLERVERHDRWGCSAAEYADQAAELLRAAGLHDLADECADEFGFDVAAVVKEIDRELERRP